MLLGFSLQSSGGFVASKGHLWSVCMYLNRRSVKERSFSWWLQRKEEQEQRGVPLMFSLQTASLHSSWQIESNGKRGGGITKTKAGIGCWFRVGENAAIVVKRGNARVQCSVYISCFWALFTSRVLITLSNTCCHITKMLSAAICSVIIWSFHVESIHNDFAKSAPHPKGVSCLPPDQNHHSKCFLTRICLINIKH